GEDLDAQAIARCVREAERYSRDDESLILLRDGQVFSTELLAFREAVRHSKFRNCAIVALKKDIPYRVLRRTDDEVSGPLSGDYYPIDPTSVVICLAGADEYEHGLASPIRVQVYPCQGNVESLVVAEDVFKLSYLNWGSPTHSYALPAPVRLAHAMASALGAGITRAGQPF